MPRNGSGVYSKPALTTAVSNTTISSARYNETIDDLVTDANAARPVVAGGTGATTAAGARDNFDVDQAVAFATKSADYTALAADNNAVHRFSAAATLSLTAAATLGADWHYTVIADGGEITIDPNGAELVNGATTQSVPDGFTVMIICDGSAFRTTSLNTTLMALSDVGVGFVPNYLSGYTISNNASDVTNDLDISTGACMDSTNSYFIKRSSALTKRLDALWTVGTNQGALDTGAMADGTYHVFAIKRLDTGVDDILFSASATSPTLPTDYTVFRRVASFVRASGAILKFTQIGDEFLLDVPVLDVDVTNQGTTATLRTLASVPSGINAIAKIRVRATASSSWSVLISSPDVADTAPAGNVAPLCDLGTAGGSVDRGVFSVRTSTLGQIRTRSTVASTDIQIATYGWTDRRGK